MNKLRLSAAARADLVEIRKFSVGEFGRDVADAYFRGFNQAFALLRDRPFAGAARPEAGAAIRCLTHRRHRIFYRIDGDLVLIIRVIHHARNAHRDLND